MAEVFTSGEQYTMRVVGVDGKKDDLLVDIDYRLAERYYGAEWYTAEVNGDHISKTFTDEFEDVYAALSGIRHWLAEAGYTIIKEWSGGGEPDSTIG